MQGRARTLEADTDRSAGRLCDWKLMELLLVQEARCRAPCGYFSRTQKEILPQMRRDVTNWMLQVCEDQQCVSAVFPLAVNYLDRFLSAVRVKKSQLQLLASVCLLIASKLRQRNPFSPLVLACYTDYSVTLEELCAWEILVLYKLQWDMASVVATDFLDCLTLFMPLTAEVGAIHKRCSNLINACMQEHQLSVCAPSVLATACIAIVGCSLGIFFADEFLTLVHNITTIPVINIRCCMERIKDLVGSSRNSIGNNANQINRQCS